MTSNWKSLVIATFNSGHECSFFFSGLDPETHCAGEDRLVKQTIHSATASAVSI